MKDLKSYVAPTDTAKLVVCHICDGTGLAGEPARVVREDGTEQEIPKICELCGGSGKLWEDERIEHTLYEQLSLGWVLLGLLGCALIIAGAEMMIFGWVMGLWMPLLGMALASIGTLLSARVLKESRVASKKVLKHTYETFYTQTGQSVEVKGKLMQ